MRQRECGHGKILLQLRNPYNIGRDADANASHDETSASSEGDYSHWSRCFSGCTYYQSACTCSSTWNVLLPLKPPSCLRMQSMRTSHMQKLWEILHATCLLSAMLRRHRSGYNLRMDCLKTAISTYVSIQSSNFAKEKDTHPPLIRLGFLCARVMFQFARFLQSFSSCLQLLYRDLEILCSLCPRYYSTMISYVVVDPLV